MAHRVAFTPSEFGSYFVYDISSQLTTQGKTLSSHDEANIISFSANQNDSSLFLFCCFGACFP